MNRSLSLAFGFAAFLAGAAPSAGQNTTATDAEIEAAYTNYLAKRGSNLDACLAALPALRGPSEEARFAVADGAPAPQPKRLVIAIDASGSMAARLGGQSKMDAARKAVLSFLAESPKDVEVGLIAFGHTGSNKERDKAQSCRGVETIYKIGTENRQAVHAALAAVKPTGWTPLAAAIEMAGTLFKASDVPGEQVVYVVSDGEETCGGDPVAAARQLRESPVRAVVNIIGFDLAAADRAQLEAVAEGGGGAFSEARDPNELRSITTEIARNTRNIRQIVAQQAGAASATVANNAAIAQAVVKARSCFASRSVQEAAAVTRHFGFNGLPAIREGVGRLIKARHADYQGRLDAYVADAESRRDAANSTIGQVREAAEKAFQEVAPK